MNLVITIFQSLSVFVLVSLHKMEIFLIQLCLFSTQWSFCRAPDINYIIADCVITTAQKAFIFATYCLFPMSFQFMQSREFLWRKIYIEGALPSTSCCIVLKTLFGTKCWQRHDIHLHLAYKSKLPFSKLCWR